MFGSEEWYFRVVLGMMGFNLCVSVVVCLDMFKILVTLPDSEASFTTQRTSHSSCVITSVLMNQMCDLVGLRTCVGYPYCSERIPCQTWQFRTDMSSNGTVRKSISTINYLLYFLCFQTYRAWIPFRCGKNNNRSWRCDVSITSLPLSVDVCDFHSTFFR